MSRGLAPSKRSEASAAALALLLALTPVIYWHFANRRFPDGDSAEYLWASLSIYRKFITSGVAAGLHALYGFRIWKPIIVPLFTLPGLFLAGGKPLAGQAIMSITFYGALALAIFSVARQFLRRFDAVLVVAFLLNLKWMIVSAHRLNTELPFALFFYSSLAFLMRSEKFSKRAASLGAGLCIGLAACVRPVETLILFPAPVVAYLVFATRSGALSLADLFCGLGELAVSVLSVALVFIFRTSLQGDSLVFFFLMIGQLLAGAVYLFSLKKYVRSNFQLFVLLSTSVALIWYGPFIFGIWDWLNYGALTRSSVSPPGRMGISLLYENLQSITLGTPGLIAFAVMLVFGWKSLSARKNPLSPKIGWAVASVWAMFALHFGLGAAAYNPDPRYYYLPISALYFSMLVIFLFGEKWIWFRRSFVMVLAGLLILARATESGIIDQNEFSANPVVAFGQFWTDAPYTKPDPVNLLFDRISPLMKKPGAPTVAIYPTLYGWPVTWFLEPFALNLVSLERNQSMEAHYIGPSLFEDWKSWHKRDGNKFDYYLVGPLENAKPELLSAIKSEGYEKAETFTLTYDTAQPPISFLWITAKH